MMSNELIVPTHAYDVDESLLDQGSDPNMYIIEYRQFYRPIFIKDFKILINVQHCLAIILNKTQNYN